MILRKQHQVSLSPRGLLLLAFEASDLNDFVQEEVARGVQEQLDRLLCRAIPEVADESARALCQGDSTDRGEVTISIVARLLWSQVH